MIALDRQQPNAIDSERAVITSLLLGSGNMLQRIGELRADQFFNFANQIIFEGMIRLDADGGVLDLVQLRQALRQRGEEGALNQLDRITAGFDGPMPDVSLVEQYAATIIEAANARALMRSCNDAMRKASENAPIVEVVSELQHAIATLGMSGERESRGIYDVVEEVHRAADERAVADRPSGILTGFASIDAQGGLPRKSGTILGGPTSHGKTALALNMIDNAVRLRPDVVGAAYSLEMSSQAIADRLIARHSRVPLHFIRDWKNLSQQQRSKVDAARRGLSEFNSRFFFADRIVSISEVVADCRKRKATAGLDLAVIDYLQLLEGISDERTRERTVNQITWQLFEMARELDISVLALSQVTPAAQMRSGGRLSIDDLRDSKAIGHHARVVLLVQRPRQSNKANTSIPRCKAVLQIEKHSEGDTGDVLLHFDGIFQEFSETLCNLCGDADDSRASDRTSREKEKSAMQHSLMSPSEDNFTGFRGSRRRGNLARANGDFRS